MTATICALVVLAGAAMPGGCREDPAALQAVKKASHSINTVAGGAEASVGIERQEAGFKKALGELAAGKADASSPLAAATGILTAASQLGSSGTSTQAAQTSMGTLSGLRSELRSAASQWAMLSAVADAAKFDAAPRLAELDAQLTAAKGEQKQAQDRLQAVRSEQDGMLSSAKERADQASKFEQDSVKLREESRRMKASDAQPVLARALEAKRQCDELRLALAKIEADALLLEPKKLGFNQRLQELEIGIASLEAERVRVVKRGEDSKVVEDDARSKAAHAQGEISALSRKIGEEREKALVPALDEIAGICKKAASSAGSAKGDGKQQTGAMLGAIAKHRLGEVLVLKAAEAKEHAAQMSELSSMKPALAGQGEYADAAKLATEAEKTAIAEAKEAIEGARTGYKSLKIKGEADQATQQAVIKYLTKLGGLEPDESEAASAPDAKPAEEGGPEAGSEKGGKPAAETASGPEAEVRASLAGLVEALKSGDAAQAAGRLYVEGASAEDLAPVIEIVASSAKLDKACQAKFNTTFEEAMKDSPMGAEGMGGIPKIPTGADAESAKIQVKGDTAIVTSEDSKPVALKKADGVWKLDFSDELGKLDANPEDKNAAAAMTKIFTELADEVNADKHATLEDVMKAMMSKLMGAMPKGEGKKEEDGGKGAGGKGGGGGGGGG